MFPRGVRGEEKRPPATRPGVPWLLYQGSREAESTPALVTPGTSAYLNHWTLDHLLSRREGRALITTGVSSDAAVGVSFAPTAYCRDYNSHLLHLQGICIQKLTKFEIPPGPPPRTPRAG